MAITITGTIKKAGLTKNNNGIWFILKDVQKDNEIFDNHLFCCYMIERRDYKSQESLTLPTPNLKELEQITITTNNIKEDTYKGKPSFSCFVSTFKSTVDYVDINLKEEEKVYIESDELPF